MKLNKLLRVFALTVMLGGLAAAGGSCSDDKTEGGGSGRTGTVTGVVLDDMDEPIPDVAVTVSDVNVTTITGVSGTATTAADGTFTVAGIPVGTHIVSFSKKDYQTAGVTITAGSFSADDTAQVSAKLGYAAAKITGTVTDAKTGGGPLPGVNVSLGGTLQTTTDNQGKYLFENLSIDSYTLTFSLANYTPVTKKIDIAAFVDGTATVDMQMGGRELLRGLTAFDLRDAGKWYYNEYRGGKSNGGGKVDWSVVYMSTLDFRGAWENQNEGVTLQIRNSGDDQQNPADLKMFDSYVFGSKLITEDNKIMTVYLRTHNATGDAPAYYGVQVIDLSAAEPEAVTVGGVRTYASESYSDVDFDLSDYVGKEVVIALGIFRQQSGDYWKQIPIRHISFAAQKAEGDNYLPGQEVPGLEGWHLTSETVRTTMPHQLKSFTGITPSGVDVSKDNNKGYYGWRGTGHIASEWAFMYVNKDVEPTPSEGYLIKTRSDAPVNTTLPESYFYAKFAIAEGNNRLTFRTRNFSGSNYTYFKLTAIKEDGTITHLAPVSNTADKAEAAPDGCWKFIHEKGGAGSPKDYAAFEYDLSQFNGQNVLLTIGVFKGADNRDENKLVFYSVDMH